MNKIKETDNTTHIHQGAVEHPSELEHELSVLPLDEDCPEDVEFDESD